MTGIFAEPPDGYTDVPLLDGERVIRHQTASYKSLWGGELVVTNQRVLFRPLDVGAAQKMIKEGVGFLPDELAVLGKVVNKVLDYTVAYGEGLAGGIETSKITGVRPGRNAGLLHPPTLVLSFGSGRTLEIGVLKSIGTPNISPANNLARDELVHVINQQLE